MKGANRADDGNRVAKRARRSREVKLKEADSKLSTVGTRTGSEAVLRAASWLGTAKPKGH